MANLQKTVLLCDVSFWNDKNDTPRGVDFVKMKSAGCPGVIIRAGQGGWIDEDFARNWQAAKAAGLARGVYWFYDSRYSPVQQAVKYVDLIKANGLPEMEMWCDYEENYGGQYAGWRHFGVFMGEVLRQMPALKLGVYTGYYYWLDHSPDPVKELAALEWFAKFPLWLAWYTADTSIVKIPRPWKSALYWQFTDHGHGPTYGAESLNVDLNYFNGSQFDFDVRYNGVTAQPEKRLYVVKDDLWANDPDRMRVGLPSAVRYRGGKGTVKLNLSWRDYVWRINDPFQRYQFTEYANLKAAVGWCNQGDPDVVEQVTFSGNLVKGYPEGERVYIDTIDVSGPIPQVEARPTEQALNVLVQLLTTQYSTYLDLTTNGRNPRTLLMSNPGEKCYMEARYLAPVTLHRATVKVTAFPSLRVRAWPSTAAATMRYILYNGSEYVQYTTQIGTDIWGRVMGGWICLRQGTNYLTTYRP